MRLFGSPDAVLWRRVELYARMTTAGNASPAGDEGLVDLKKCADPECRCKKRARRLDGELICSHCGALWPFELRVQLPNEYQHSPRPQTRDELLTELAEMDLVLSKPTLWEQRAFAVYVLGRLSYEEASSVLRKLYPRAPFKWCPWRVRMLVRGARDTMGDFLELIELLAA